MTMVRLSVMVASACCGCVRVTNFCFGRGVRPVPKHYQLLPHDRPISDRLLTTPCSPIAYIIKGFHGSDSDKRYVLVFIFIYLHICKLAKFSQPIVSYSFSKEGLVLCGNRRGPPSRPQRRYALEITTETVFGHAISSHVLQFSSPSPMPRCEICNAFRPRELASRAPGETSPRPAMVPLNRNLKTTVLFCIALLQVLTGLLSLCHHRPC